VAATAFDLKGLTRSGARPHGGIVSADPAFLPLGTRIRVTGAGQFSGVYLVTDTGAKVSAGASIFMFRVGSWPSDLERNQFPCRF